MTPDQAVRYDMSGAIVRRGPLEKAEAVASEPPPPPPELPRAEPERPVFPPINSQTFDGKLFLRLRTAAGLTLKEAADCLKFEYAVMLDFEDGNDDMIVFEDHEIDRVRRFFIAVDVLPQDHPGEPQPA
jgi:hypothetical protein